MGCRKRKANGHGKVEAVGSWLGSGDDEKSADSCPESWLGGSGDAQGGGRFQELANVSLHNYSFLLSIHVAMRPLFQGPALGGMGQGWQGMG